MEVIKTGEKFGVIKEKINNALDYTVPVGTVLPYVGRTAPDGWLLCDGKSYSRKEYKKLADIISNGETTQTFTVPDFSARYMMGMNMDVPSNDSYSQSDGTIKAYSIGSMPVTYNRQDGTYLVYSSPTNTVLLPNVALRFIIKY